MSECKHEGQRLLFVKEDDLHCNECPGGYATWIAVVPATELYKAETEIADLRATVERQTGEIERLEKLALYNDGVIRTERAAKDAVESERDQLRDMLVEVSDEVDALQARVAELEGSLVRVKRYLSIPRGLKRIRREEGALRMVEKALGGAK